MYAEEILISSITESPTNPRTFFEESALIELAESIATVGVIQPVILRPVENDTYELVVGARRFRASKIAGKSTIPGNIKNLTDEEVLYYQTTENLQRQDLNPMEQAYDIERLLSIRKSVYDIAHLIGKSEKFIYQRLSLVRLHKEAQDMVAWGQLPLQHAYKVSALDEKKQVECLKHIMVRDADKNIVSVRNVMELNWWIKNNSIKDLTTAPFDLKDKQLCSEAGSCIGCAKRTSVNPALFEEYANENKCLDPQCYDKKVKAHVDHIVEIMRSAGTQPVLISDAPYGQQKNTLGHLAYEFKDPKKKCEHCQLAVIVHSDKGNEGKQANICVHEKCPTLNEDVAQAETSLEVVAGEKVTPEKLQRDTLVLQLSRADIINNHVPEKRAAAFLKNWCMFYNMSTEFQQKVVKELAWTIDWGEGPQGDIELVNDTTSEEFFFDNFTGSTTHVEVIESMYIMEMFLAVDKEGRNGRETHDTFINENVTAFMVKAERKAGKIADKLIALHEEKPDKSQLKGITADMLLLAFKTENDLIMLADKLGMTLDLKEETTRKDIAILITTWKQS